MSNGEAEHQIITRLDDALALYDEPVWRELRAALTTPEKPLPPAEAPKEWYKAHPERLAKERAVLTKLLTAVPDCPTLFFHNTKTDRLGATGLVNMTGGRQVKIEILYPNDYPASPPRIFFFGPALKRIPQLLREDGSVPVPFGPTQPWTEISNGGIVLNWAIEWLEQTMKLQAAPPPGGPAAGRRRP
jgi:hypothetical protein